MRLIAIVRKAVVPATMLFCSLVSMAQTLLPVKGKITSSSGTPLSGVTIQVKGSNVRTLTAEDGSFSLSAPADAVLLVSSIGYSSQEVAVANRSQLSLSLAQQANTMESVVVIGYGTQKRKNLSGAVTSFNAENLDERPVLRVDQALVGQMAGVQVKQSSGALGRGMSVQVRGAGSISAGNEPLYVIDGFPLATASPNSAGGYSTGNPLDNMNPNDIESIQVLKDAAAAAIYGSRAANGVVIITTKRGRAGKAQVNLNSYVGFSEASRTLDMLSPVEWIDRAREIINGQWVASGAGRTAAQTNEERRVLLGLAPGVVNTAFMTDDRWDMPGRPGLRLIDWQKEAFRKGLVQNHQVSISGGNEIVKYYVSTNLTNQEGMIRNTNYRSYSARANVEVNASKKFKLGLNIAPTYSINDDPGVEGKDNILHQLVSYTPVQEDTMGLYPNFNNYGQYRWSNSPNSPIAKLENIIGRTRRYRTLTSMFADYALIKGLNFRTTINLDNTDNTSKSYTPYTVTNNLATRQAQLAALAAGAQSNFRRQTFVNENTLTFDHSIADRHDINLLAGASYNMDKIDFIRMNAQNGFNSAVINTLNAANAVTGNTTEARNVLLSYFGRMQYSFDDKYLFSASLRRDGSSRFGANTKWGWFPSASFAWRVMEENFMDNVPYLSDLKLRASWGNSGNYNIGDYSTIPTLGVNNYSFNGASVIGQAPAGITNPDLSWEQSETYNAGIDIGLFKNRITASFDYYNKLNTDLLLNVPVAAATGFSSYLSNAGKVRNTGWEIELTSRNTTGAFQWNTSANFSHNANKVVALADGQTQTLIPSAFDIAHSVLRVGLPMYSIFVVKQIGILSQDDIAKGAARYGTQVAGDPKYFDADGNGVIDANDRVVVGQPNPKYTYGVTNNFRYKGFDLSVLVQGQWGGSIYSLFGRAINRTGQGFSDNAIGAHRNRWRSDASAGDGLVGKAYSNFGRIKNTDWLYASDYIRVRNITLGYNLGQLFKTGKHVQSARVYLTAENFFGKDKYTGGFNPEATNTDVSGSGAYPEPGDYGGLPLPRSLIFGFNFNF